MPDLVGTRETGIKAFKRKLRKLRWQTSLSPQKCCITRNAQTLGLRSSQEDNLSESLGGRLHFPWCHGPAIPGAEKGRRKMRPRVGHCLPAQVSVFGLQASQGAQWGFTDGVTLQLTSLRISSGDWQLIKEVHCLPANLANLGGLCDLGSARSNSRTKAFFQRVGGSANCRPLLQVPAG